MKQQITVLLLIVMLACQTKNDFEKYYSDAYAEIDKQDFKGAIEYLDKAIQLNYKADSLYTLRGYCYYRLGDFERTIKESEKALAFNPQNDYAYF